MLEKISIVVPVYNAQEYLHRCIDSILNQTYTNIEIVLLDDGSRDTSWQIICDYKQQHPDIIVAIKHDNMGVSKTRNKGIKLATGKYLMFADNDDYMDVDYIETFYQYISKNQLDVVIGGYKRPNSRGEIIQKTILENGEYAKYKIVAAWAKIFNREYIIKNDIEFLPSNIGEDIHFTIQAVLLTDKIKVIDYVGYNWYYNEESVSNTLHKSVSNKLQIDFLLNSVYEKLKSKNIEMDDYLEYYFIKLVIWYLLYTTKKASRQTIAKEYQNIFQWLDIRFPNYKKNNIVGFFKPKGEEFSKRVIVAIFMILHKLHLGKLFLLLSSKL